MFQAVRQWWRSGRGKRTSRLFAFELTVVMIGVVAAQQVSNWAQRRSALSEVEGVHRGLVHNFEIYRRIAASHRQAAPCINQRIDLILRQAGNRQSIDPSLLAPIELASMGPDSISADNEQLLRERYGDAVTDQITSVEFNLRISEESSGALAQQWFALERINPRYGAIDDADRAAARDAAVRIKAYLAALVRSAGFIEDLTDKLGIRANPAAKLRPAASCDDVWRTGRGFRGDG